MKKQFKNVVFTLLLSSFFVACEKKQVEPATDFGMAEEQVNAAAELEGIYNSILPAADCDGGIDFTLELKTGNEYTLKEEYICKDNSTFNTQGTFTWIEEESKIELKENDGNRSFLFKDGKLFALDADGKVVEGDLADMYVLEKVKK